MLCVWPMLFGRLCGRLLSIEQGGRVCASCPGCCVVEAGMGCAVMDQGLQSKGASRVLCGWVWLLNSSQSENSYGRVSEPQPACMWQFGSAQC